MGILIGGSDAHRCNSNFRNIGDAECKGDLQMKRRMDDGLRTTNDVVRLSASLVLTIWGPLGDA
jgi:hypothetical protein